MPTSARNTLMVFVVAALALAAFNSSALITWAYDLPPGQVSELFLTAAESWHEVMTAIGLAGITEFFRDHVALIFGS